MYTTSGGILRFSAMTSTQTREELLAFLQSRLPELSDERLRFLYSVVEQEEAERNAPSIPQEVIDSLDAAEQEIENGNYITAEEFKQQLLQRRPNLNLAD